MPQLPPWLNGKGSRIALNLSDAGTLHPPSYLERALLDPNGTAATMPESRFVRAVTNKGTVIIGRRMNEDTYTIQLMDDHENLVTLEKDDLKSLTVIKDSPMPSMKGKFTDEQISDVVAYLASLKSSQVAAPTGFGVWAGNRKRIRSGRQRTRGDSSAGLGNRASGGGGSDNNSWGACCGWRRGSGSGGTQRPGGNP